MIKRVTKDFETRSKCDLKKHGAFIYSLDPSTQPTCLAFKDRTKTVVYFLPFQTVNTNWLMLPQNLKDLWLTYLSDPSYEFSAHNSFFERCIYDNIMVARYGWPAIDPKRRRCTAAKAAACALPRNLEGAGEAMKLRTQKDKRGYQAMMKTCKPTREWNAWNDLQKKVKSGAKITEASRLKAMKPEPPVFLEPEVDPETWNTLYTYCKIDVRAEEELDLALPDLIPNEQEIWHLNQTLNWRGLHVDIPTVKKISDIMEIESKKKLKELDTLTMGLVTKPGARKSILDFLELEGIVLPDIRSKTVDDALKGFHLSDDMRTLLEIRKALSMTSTKKYHSFLNRAYSDNRVRDILMYHGASPGRDTGTGIQPHNFPRGILEVDKSRPYAAVENVAECDHEMLNILYGPSLGILFSALLRNMIIPSAGHELFVADFSKIEVAVLWWLSGNEKGLEVLRSGKDPYIYQAAVNLGKTYEEVEIGVKAEEAWAVDARQLGKAQILGSGFGMGAPKFQKTAWDMYRLKLTIEQSRKAVASYRTNYEAVPKLWKSYEHAAITAVKAGVPQFSGKCKFFVENNFLWVELPSGRRLAYKDPQISWRVRQYEKVTAHMVDGEEVLTTTIEFTAPMETFEFWAVNSKTKKWSLERTWGGTLTENIVQAVARDLMMLATTRLEKANYKVLLTVHDEGICEKPIGTGNLIEFVKILCELPAWAIGLPLEAKGWKGPRYRK